MVAPDGLPSLRQQSMLDAFAPLSSASLTESALSHAIDSSGSEHSLLTSSEIGDLEAIPSLPAVQSSDTLMMVESAVFTSPPSDVDLKLDEFDLVCVRNCNWWHV